ncbi:MAG: hypothetical protein V2I25_13780 [Woeseiaceae bacterium]|jgi:hypothetical protein|nr:hypothetical protein [Woeseiaceae bacterium]
MANATPDNVDYRLLSRLSSLVLCSKCFQSGKVTPVPQLITTTRRPANLCPGCRTDAIESGSLGGAVRQRGLARVLAFKA